MNWNESIPLGIAIISVFVTIVSLIAAFKAGIFRGITFEDIRSANDEWSSANCDDISSTERSDKIARIVEPFETKHLALYYTQVLVQSKVAFWFSLIFAALGFTVIIVAVFMNNNDKLGMTFIQGTAGVIVDAIAALFFVQSNRVQESMAKFFEKLRLDRQQVESRSLCDSIQSTLIKDHLKVILSLQYANVGESKVLSQHLLTMSNLLDKSGEKQL